MHSKWLKINIMPRNLEEKKKTTGPVLQRLVSARQTTRSVS